MNLFECVLKTSSGGGSGADLIVTCDSVFAGATITCTDGGSNTFTEVCPSVSPYIVTFESIPTGTYTVSGTYSGQTYSATVTITDFTALLAVIPDGSTVTPVNDIQIWLHCAYIWDKSYTTLNEVLADNTTLLALISDNNAVDYMVRSTSWASSVCANQTAMGYIGNNDYCADTLLADSTWLNAICNSTYFESVLNVKVPTMTSDTAPSGQCIADSAYSGYPAYHAFRGIHSTASGWASNIVGANVWVGYKFTQKVRVLKAYINGEDRGGTVKIQGSNDNSTWTDLKTGVVLNTNRTAITTNFSNNTKYQYYRIYFTVEDSRALVSELQFYGRT